MTEPSAPTPPSLEPESEAPAGASGYVEIDLDAIRDNVRELRRRAGDAELMAVVKADAYGHGALPSARAALAGGATWLGVAQLAEALHVRAAGITAPMLTWLYVPGADFDAAILAGIDLGVAAPWALDAIIAAARRRGTSARIHLKVDTGLTRGGALGTGWGELIAAAARAHAERSVEIVGVWSHFAYADAPDHPTVRSQQRVFEDAVAELARAGITDVRRHLANSAATLTNPSAHYDLVRPGLAVYGLSPIPDLQTSAQLGLREAMRVIARLALVKAAPAGAGVSYGHTYHTAYDTTVGLVPLGYADGIPRAGTNVGEVLVAGRRLPIAGRVCMDQFVLDLGPEASERAGEEVVVIGRAHAGEPTAEDWARATGTISYEIVTRMGPRLPRVYLAGA
ncbi:MAG: alanine racemase [Tetrasphaera sp.]